MMQLNGSITLSASDLAAFLGCTHRTALDMAVAVGARAKPHVEEDPLWEPLQLRGLAHEAQYVGSLRASGRSVLDLRDGTFAERVEQTLGAMRAGVDVIVQGALQDRPWMGYPDVLLRVETASAFGAWSYEVVDTKLSRETRAGTILQLGLYSAMLHTAQGAAPRSFHVVTPDPVSPQQTYRVNDYAAYVRLVCAQLKQTVARPHAEVAQAHYPEPVEQCVVCRWQSTCATQRRADDHLSLVAGISRTQRDELASRAVDTLTDLSSMALPMPFKPRRGSVASYERVREQARLQVASRTTAVPAYEVLDTPAPSTEAFREQPPMGLHRLPEPSAGDLFLDLEGDPFVADGGREYLFGLVDANGQYRARWAFSEGEEKAAFVWVMDTIAEAIAAHPDMHVYHYAPYEPAAFKRLMGRHATRERELDTMLRAERFVDLYGVVRQGLRVGVERYSIKNLEPLYGYTRDVPLREANRVLREMELGLMTGTAHTLPREVHAAVEGYNRDDCVSTLRLRNWLETVRSIRIASGVEIPRPTPQSGAASAAVDEKAQRVEALRARLLDGVPEDRTARDAAAQGRWLLAYMLDYHRREDKATWWEYFRLRE
ncbi:MAG: TM0106 family RecB-like putative nuclease, partial [Gemmatimonadaceae bacterium]|nr:TM0106 family RecB-like putative nuclease [Gemmatimonadaceae bacterium]